MLSIPGTIDGTGTYDRLEYWYNRQGERIEVYDQNKTTREFSYDKLGRQIIEEATVDGESDIDHGVLRIDRAYNVRGALEKVTCYDDTDLGEATILNQVTREYNDLDMLVKDFQEHEGAKNGDTLYIEYDYDDTVVSGELTRGMRPEWVGYPDGRKVFFDYDPSTSHAHYLNRLDAIKDDDNGSAGITLAKYSYLGLGTIVIEDFQQPDVKLDYETSGSYAGFDAFGRVVQQLWTDYGPDPDVVRDKYTYGYDRAGNRNYRENTSSLGKDEYYTYDGMYRLETAERGDLTGTPPTGVTSKSFAQQWKTDQDPGLDPLGNWTDFWQDDDGNGWDLKQSRVHNKANETTEITKTVGTDWFDPLHDKAGNMTGVPKPSVLDNGLTCKYDAWNRLVEVKDGQTVVAKYEYDGLNRRIKKHIDSQSPASPNGIDKYEHYFYDGVQVVETRDTTTESDQPENLAVVYQYIWSPRYIDAPILREDVSSQNNDRHYFLTDANMNVTCLVDASGDAEERYLYNPYGKVTIYDGSWSNPGSTSSYNNAILYTGRRLDRETGLYFYRARYYSAELGRFLSRDPIGLGGGDGNLYRYVGNGPTSTVDPSGLLSTMHPYYATWDWKIREGKDKHVEGGRYFVYYHAAGVNKAYDLLFDAKDQIANIVIDPKLKHPGQYNRISNWVTIPKPLASVSVDTVIHESVHALVDMKHWYWFWQLEMDEALAWTVEKMLGANCGATRRLKTFERDIRNGQLYGEKVDAEWTRLWGATQIPGTILGPIIEWRFGSRNIESRDVKDVADKLGMKFSCENLRVAYVKLLDELDVRHCGLACPPNITPGFE